MLVWEDDLVTEDGVRRPSSGAYVEAMRRLLDPILRAYRDAFTDSRSHGSDGELTAYQRACQRLHAALAALRKSGNGSLKEIFGCAAPSSNWQLRLLTYARSAAFFHGRKVDARNLP